MLQLALAKILIFSFIQFVALFATLALANAGLIAEQPTYYSAPAAVKTLVQPVAYAADHQQYHYQQPASSSYSKTISYSQPKAYIAQAAPVHSYHSYEPEHHYVQSYHHEPEHQVYAAQPVYGHYEHGSSEQNIVRSAHGTVSHISKAVDTPHSSVRKYDTRVINDGYKTVSYAQPTAYVAQPASYVAQPAAYVAHAQPAHHYVSQPAVHSYATPVLAKTSVVAQPLLTKVAQPVITKTVSHVAQPQHYQYAAQPQHYQYAAQAPVIAAKVHYSPAIEVSHTSFESPVAHYQW